MCCGQKRNKGLDGECKKITNVKNMLMKGTRRAVKKHQEKRKEKIRDELDRAYKLERERNNGTRRPRGNVPETCSDKDGIVASRDVLLQRKSHFEKLFNFASCVCV